MRTHRRAPAPLLLWLALALGALPTALPGRAEARHFICPPCGLPCDTTVFDAPGVCPKCGMALVDQDSLQQNQGTQRNVGILIFTGVEIIDYTGPYEVFGAAGFNVYTVAETRDPITTAMGMSVVPKYTFADAPKPDVLVVPGGAINLAQKSEATLRWVADVTGRAEHTMSVCNGAFILAKAGLLDGLRATTTAGNLERLRTGFPKIEVVENQRYVDNGKIITTGGLSAGIDGALHVVDRMLGTGTAQQVALVEEYDWHVHSEFARAALADRILPSIDWDGVGKWDVVSTDGGTDRWKTVAKGTSSLSAAELMDRVSQAFAKSGKWTSAGAATASAKSSPALTGTWKTRDRAGKPWTGTVTIEGAAPSAGSRGYVVRMAVARAG
jgi:putative intracellular protease/amidase